MLTKAEKEIIELLRKFPAMRIRGNSYRIGNRSVSLAMLERMRGKGLLKMGAHPDNPMQNGFIVNENPPNKEHQAHPARPAAQRSETAQA